MSRRMVFSCALATLAVASLSLGACGSSPKASKTGNSSAVAKITADWVAFFSGSTPASRRIELVQDGASFAAIIKAQAGTPLAKGVTAKVSKVTLKSATDAQVKYSVTMGGTTVLADQLGEAVVENGTWKVSASSFCALLALEQAKVPVCSTSPGTTS